MNYLKSYVNYLERFADLKRPLKVVFDCSNGTAGIVLRGLKIKNCKLQIINPKPDGRFPAHGPDPSKPNALNRLGQAVKKYWADLGVAFDADADRALFVDENSEPIDSYLIACLLFLNSRPPFVADIFVFEALKYAGLIDKKTFPSKIGSYFVKKNMARYRATLGAEFSGHYYHKDFFSLDSGILTAIKVMNAASRLPYPLSQFKKMLPQGIDAKLINIKTVNPQKYLNGLKKRYRRKAEKMLEIDGLTFEFEKGWLTARPSNTEPLIRIFSGKVV